MKQRLSQKWRPDFWFFVKVLVIASMCLFIVYPFYTILTKSIFSDKEEGVTLYNFIRFFTKEYYYQPLIRFSLKADECFFVDDLPANIEGALFCGIPGTVFHGDAALLRQQLKHAGVNL